MVALGICGNLILFVLFSKSLYAHFTLNRSVNLSCVCLLVSSGQSYGRINPWCGWLVLFRFLLSLSVCLSVPPFVCFVGVYIQLFCLSVYLSVCLSVCLFVSLTYSFSANYYLNFPRPDSIWLCSLVGRATVICSGVRDLFSFSMWAHFLSRANAHKVIFGIIIIEHFNLSHLNRLYICLSV